MTADWLSTEEWEQRMEDVSYRPTFTVTEREALAKAMDMIDQRDRDIVEMTYSGFGQEQIAHVMGCSHQAIAQATEVAMRRLRAVAQMLMVDWDSITSLEQPVTNRYLKMSQRALLDVWMHTRVISKLAEVLEIHKLTAAKLINELRDTLKPYCLDHHLDVSVRQGRVR